MVLSGEFPGFDAKYAAIDDIMMVGAEYGNFRGLSGNDSSLLAFFLTNLKDFKIPYHSKFAIAEDPLAEGGEAPVDVVNKLSEFGGRNFFAETGNPNAIILCNIPADPPSGVEDWTEQRGLTAWEAYRLRRSFSVSDNHTPENWRGQIARLSPKILFLCGPDSFEPEDLRPDGYISIRDVSYGMSFLISREYLEKIEPILLRQNSILIDCLVSDDDCFRFTVQNPTRRDGRVDYNQKPLSRIIEYRKP
jgi:hypothetical protein